MKGYKPETEIECAELTQTISKYILNLNFKTWCPLTLFMRVCGDYTDLHRSVDIAFTPLLCKVISQGESTNDILRLIDQWK